MSRGPLPPLRCAYEPETFRRNGLEVRPGFTLSYALAEPSTGPEFSPWKDRKRRMASLRHFPGSCPNHLGVNVPWRHFLGSCRKDLVDWCSVTIAARAFRAWPKRSEYPAARERCVADGTFPMPPDGDKTPCKSGFVSSRTARTRRKPQFRVIRGGKTPRTSPNHVSRVAPGYIVSV